MRKLLLTFAILATTTSVQAQPAAPAPEKEYTVQLTLKELDYVFGLIVKQPFAEVAPIVNKIQQQVARQQQPVVTAPQPEAKKE